MFYIKSIVVLVMVSVFGFYIFHQTEGFLTGPEIFVEYPKNGQLLACSFVVISGKASNASKLFVNGAPVIEESSGNFKKDLILARGYNVIELSAEDKFNRTINKKLEVIVK